MLTSFLDLYFELDLISISISRSFSSFYLVTIQDLESRKKTLYSIRVENNEIYFYFEHKIRD